MKGLLLKDFYLLKKYCWAFLIFVVLFAAGSITTDIPLFVFYPCLLTGVLPMTLQSYDEREKWTVYSGTLPYTKAQLVSAKYIMGLLLSTFALVLAMIAQIVKMMRNGSFSAEGFLTILIVEIGVGLFPSSILLPFVFRLGAEKARLAYYCLIGVICGMSVFLTSLLVFEEGVTQPAINPPALVLVGLGAVVFYALSWLLSIFWYQKREI